MTSFNRQLEQEIPSLRRYARSLSGSAHQADDLVQDCLERALTRQNQWRPGSDLRAWLFTLMHNLYANQVRDQARHPLVPLDDQLPAASVSTTDPSLPWLMSRLPFAQREVVALVVLEGFSYQQVAEIIGLPIGTVMSRLSRGRENLRNGLQEPSPPLRRVK